MMRYLPLAPRSVGILFLIAVALVFLAPGAAQASDASSTPPSISSAHQPSICFGWFEIEWRSILGNRRRMIQVALIAVFVGIGFLLKGRIK